jgi:uncharacterized protein YjcR
MSKVDFSIDDLTKAALKRLVQQLLAATEGEEEKILSRLEQKKNSEKESSDLADLKDEKKGKPSTVDMNAEPTRRKRDG